MDMMTLQIMEEDNLFYDMLIERSEIRKIISDMRDLAFAEFFGFEIADAQALTDDIEESVAGLIDRAVNLAGAAETSQVAEARELASRFAEQIPQVAELLRDDLAAHYEGDPAAGSYQEIIIAYPGLYAICVHRLAHILYKLGVPILPRLMSEYAHSKTGIDINPGAEIGRHFFIDHGTGIVIGETTVIGDGVQIYQGVTLGALSPRHGQSLAGKKRHPTVGDNVTIYANATILGGDTYIKSGSVIAGNSVILETVE